jgi:3-deoxy-D-manno-octulosonate 8-phosphate phosphatase (KDO 8-P phosphatase)
MLIDSATLQRLGSGIEVLLLDVDGVLTDGAIILDDNGVESKNFHVRDGSAIAWWRSLGKKTALVTGRRSRVVEVRAAELKIDYVRQGEVDKLPPIREILAAEGLTLAQACYVGDDLQDLPALRAVGFGATVADACAEVRAEADYVCRLPGGRGAVREVVELLLKIQGLWHTAVRKYFAENS